MRTLAEQSSIRRHHGITTDKLTDYRITLRFFNIIMADELKAESVVTEATDMKGAANIYYTLAVEKIKDVCVSV